LVAPLTSLIEEHYRHCGPDTQHASQISDNTLDSLMHLLVLKAATFRLKLPDPELQRLLEEGKLLPGKTELPRIKSFGR
jgi:hypothetical protein